MDVDARGPGDVLFVAQPRPAIVAAKKRGIYLIGIGYPMVTDKYSPPGYKDFPTRPSSTSSAMSTSTPPVPG